MLRPLLVSFLTSCSIVHAASAAGHAIAPIRFAPSEYAVSNAAIASNGNAFLAVWQVDTDGGGKHIDGAVLDSAGRRLSPVAIRILPFTDAYTIQLSEFGSNYLLAWTDSERVATLNLVEVSPDGKLV